MHAVKKQDQQIQIPKKQIQIPKKQIDVQKKQFQLPVLQKKQQQQPQQVVASPTPGAVSGTAATVAVGGRR